MPIEKSEPDAVTRLEKLTREGHVTEEVDPYETPKAALSAQTEGLNEPEKAGRWRRFGEYFIDVIVQWIIGFAIGLATAVMYGRHNWLTDLGFLGRTAFGSAVFVAYYFILEATTDRTVGKLLLGTKVVTEAGGKPSVAQVLGRTLGRFIPFEALFIFGDEKQCGHDSLSSTRVVRLR